MELFDSHTHWNDEKFNQDREVLIPKIYQEGITKMMIPGYSLTSSKKAIQIASNYSFLYAACGISPNDIPQTNQELQNQIEQIRRLVLHEEVKAIGEIGYDFYWNKDNKQLQKEAFKKQIDIANEFKLPIIIHSRDAVMDTLAMLKENPVEKKGIFHCCQFNPELIKEAVKLGFYISFAGPVTFKNASNAENAVLEVPLHRLLIETDSPYLAPEPNRGKRNDSSNVYLVAQKIAQIRKLDIEEIAKTTYENACQVFQIK